MFAGALVRVRPGPATAPALRAGAVSELALALRSPPRSSGERFELDRRRVVVTVRLAPLGTEFDRRRTTCDAIRFAAFEAVSVDTNASSPTVMRRLPVVCSALQS